MTFICYEPKDFRAASLKTIDQANEIIAAYSAQGFTLTLRQLYYQFVSRDLRPNTDRSYKNLGNLMNDARLAGLVSWDAIEDRGRTCERWLIEEDPAQVLDGIEYRLSLDFWERQNTYVEVWVEKDALSSVVERPCRRWKTPYMACKGYLSASEMWRAGQRFEAAADAGMRVIMIHLGDHDPSGVDMTRDNDTRLDLLSRQSDVEVRRIALNMDQVELYNPPPNPAKITDSRAEEYIRSYGRTSWELDALEPRVLDELIDTELRSLIDMDLWTQTRGEQEDMRELLAKLSDNWDEVEPVLRNL